MDFIKLTGINNNPVIISVRDIRDVRVWPGPTAAAVFTFTETYLVQETVEQIGEKLDLIGRVV
jgi:uncharacterized protein YlzI (FlbEa/FlbD family)